MPSWYINGPSGGVEFLFWLGPIGIESDLVVWGFLAVVGVVQPVVSGRAYAMDDIHHSCNVMLDFEARFAGVWVWKNIGEGVVPCIADPHFLRSVLATSDPSYQGPVSPSLTSPPP